MFISKPLPAVSLYIDALNEALKEYNLASALTNIQKKWFSFCITAIMLTNTVCWAQFKILGFGQYSITALSWIFRKANIPWDRILVASTLVILNKYGIDEGILDIDDTYKKRSKSTKNIPKVHKVKHKSSGGYIQGQSLVFLVLVTPKITIPVGVDFYMPDPELAEWNKQDKKRKKQGLPKDSIPAKPLRNKDYPTMPEIALTLLRQFRQNNPDIRIKCILADALYGASDFIDKASAIFDGVQVISQIRSNQNIIFRNKKIHVAEYFKRYAGTDQTLVIRGGKQVKASVGSARLKVCSHKTKRFIIALKYQGEEEYRYIIAKDLSWRTLDIVQAYTLRWLVEVFFQDWKGNEGWGNLTKHTGEKGSARSLTLSLMVDHSLFFHPDQLALLDNNLPAFTVGSLIGKIKVECFLNFVQDIISSNKPAEALKELAKMLENNVIKLRPSSKHMVNRDIGCLQPSPSLKYKNIT